MGSEGTKEQNGKEGLNGSGRRLESFTAHSTALTTISVTVFGGRFLRVFLSGAQADHVPVDAYVLIFSWQTYSIGLVGTLTEMARYIRVPLFQGPDAGP